MIITPSELEVKIAENVLPSKLDEIKWGTLDQTSKFIALKRANAEINRIPFIGLPVLDTQEDSWPRYVNGQVVQAPEAVKDAICLIVYDFLKTESDSRLELMKSGVEEVKIEGASEKYDLSVVKESEKRHFEYRALLTGLIYRGVGGYRGE